MSNKIITITHKPTGKRYWMEYKFSWGQHYFSFDNGVTWNKSKIIAFQQALKTNTLAERRGEG